MTTFFIDPTAASGGDGSATHPLNTWSGVGFTGGNAYLQKAGTTYSGGLEVTGRGSAAAPIFIGAYGSGNQPVINGFVDFLHANDATLYGMQIENAAGAAVLVQQGSNHITVAGNTLSGSQVGLWLGNGAGGSNLIGGNIIAANSSHGVAVGQVANLPGDATQIVANTITGNGGDGIELGGSNFVVDSNAVTDNGRSESGTSGIHVFGGLEGAPDGYGVGNTITNNMVVGNHDRWASDGNGIELDQYTHHNGVAGNVAAGNDGGGIVLFDSYANIVAGNLLVGNGVDSGHTHGMAGDLLLHSHLAMTVGNTLSDNVVIVGPSVAELLDEIASLARIRIR